MAETDTLDAPAVTIAAEVVGYTPGPWIYAGEVKPVGDPIDRLWCGDVTPAHEIGKYRGEIATIQSADHIRGISCAEAAANARLIGAAPDLVEALKYAVEQLEAYKTTSVGIHHAAIERGYAALAKAGVR